MHLTLPAGASYALVAGESERTDNQFSIVRTDGKAFEIELTVAGQPAEPRPGVRPTGTVGAAGTMSITGTANPDGS
jgi:hypothetical protein